MSAFQVNVIILIIMFTVLVVIGLMCLDGKVENTFDCRPLVVAYSGGLCVLGSGVHVHSGRIPYDGGCGY